MRYKFFSHLIPMIALNLLAKPLSIYAIDAELQNRIGKEEYGIYFAILNFSYLFNILLDFGLTNFNTREVAGDPESRKRSFHQLFPIRIILLLLYFGFTLGIAWMLGYDERQFHVLWILLFSQFFISTTFFIRSYFAGLLMFRTEILFSALDKILLVLLAGYWLYFQNEIPISVENLAWLNFGIYGLTSLLALTFLLGKIGWPAFNWNFGSVKKILSRSIPFGVLIVFMMLYNRLDSVMLERLHEQGNEQAGTYAQSYRILDGLFMFASMFSTLLFPLFSRLLKNRESVVELLDSSARVLLMGSMLAAAIGLFYGNPVLELFYHEDIVGSLPTFQVLMLSFIPVSGIVLCGTLLTAHASLRYLIIVSLGGIVINAGLNFYLIPEYGAYGAAISTLATQSLVVVLQLLKVWEIFRFQWNWWSFLRYLGLATLLFFSGKWMPDVGWVWYEVALLVVLVVLYALMTHMIQWKLFLKLLKAQK
ncbi:MAG: hypothetical protein EP338_03565 [Bacteroidetes bacterium]|nr:MAG: hypothetical protein EP338_03565 [Bacteroidota bacterium]